MIKLPASLKSYCLSALIILLITPIFLESFGTATFSQTELKNESRSLYFLSSLIGQVAFSLFTSINNGVLVFPCFEVNYLSQSIFLNNQKSLELTLGCLLCASMITVVFALVIYITKTGCLLARVPRNVVDTMMITTGLLLILSSTSLFINKQNFAISAVLIFISFIITSLAVFILKYTGNPRLLVLYLISLIFVFNLASYCIGNELFNRYMMFPFIHSEPLSLHVVFEMCKKISFDMSAISKNGYSILALGIHPLISIATSMPYYIKCLDVDMDFNHEMLAQGLANAFSIIGFFPVSFNCSGSLLFALTGANSKMHSLVSGVSLIALLFTFHRICPLIPAFAMSSLSQFIGILIILGYIPQILLQTWLDKLTILICLVGYVILKFNVINLIVFGFIVNYLTFLHYGSNYENYITHELVHKVLTLRVTGSLDFRNFHLIASDMERGATTVLIDLQLCTFVDYSANLELLNLTERLIKRNITIKIKGKPKNLARYANPYLF